MPTYNLPLDVPQSTIDAIEQASPGKRERLQEIMSEELARYAKNLLRIRTPAAPLLKVVIDVPGNIGKRVVELANKREQARSHVFRQAMCDFMHLPAKHIDREYRASELARQYHVTGTSQLRAYMRDEDTTRAKLYGSANRYEFVHKFLPQWLDTQEKKK